MPSRARLLALAAFASFALTSCGAEPAPPVAPKPTERLPGTFALSEAVRDDLAEQKDAARKRNAEFESLLEAK